MSIVLQARVRSEPQSLARINGMCPMFQLDVSFAACTLTVVYGGMQDIGADKSKAKDNLIKQITDQVRWAILREMDAQSIAVQAATLTSDQSVLFK